MRGAILLGLLLLASASAQAACNPGTSRVVIDVGHTNVSPGATSARGQPEHAFNMALAQVLKSRLAANGFANVVVLVRSGPENLGARAAAIAAARPDLLISVHHDSVQKVYQQPWDVNGTSQLYSDRYTGWSLLIATDNAFAQENRALATLIADALLGAGLTFSSHHAEAIRGENRPFVDSSRGIYRYDRLAVLKFAPAPAVLLEAGIILNRNDETALASPQRQALTANAVASAMRRYCGG